ncbi:MAG: hypothetical protein U9N73_06610, partial [Candidatus Auribacterota bacterium]|nr:hypothetical protein [Candidatus Auribacterota bacterium]
ANQTSLFELPPSLKLWRIKWRVKKGAKFFLARHLHKPRSATAATVPGDSLCEIFSIGQITFLAIWRI